MDQIVSLLIKAGAVLLALIAVLVGGYAVFAKNNGSTAASEQSQLATNISGYINGGMTTRNYSGLDNSVAIKAGLVPKSMQNGDGTTILGPWGSSQVTIAPWNQGHSEAWTNVDGDACATFARSQNADRVAINGSEVAMSDPQAAINIANNCNATSGVSQVSVTFEYSN
ncbi:type 4 pilus major pilin [Gluconobacter cerinus]|nr:hypothetical protein GFGA_2d0066 [Gluconobacter frateurii NBRC 103465]